MTVNELIEMLEDIASEGNGDKEVKFITDYGDYYNTQQALDVNAACGQDVWGKISVKKSGYSQSGYRTDVGDDCIGICLDGGCLPEEDDEDDEEDNGCEI